MNDSSDPQQKSASGNTTMASGNVQSRSGSLLQGQKPFSGPAISSFSLNFFFPSLQYAMRKDQV